MIFRGISTEDGEQFLHNFNSYCTLYSFKNKDARILAAFGLHLEGPAKIWFAGLEDISSWETVEAEFKDKYITNNAAQFNINAEKFNSLKLQHHQSIEEFFSAIVECSRKLQKSNQETILQFLNGLPEKLAFFARSSNPQTLEEAFQATKMGDSYGYRQDAVGSVATAQQTKTGREAKVDLLSKQVAELLKCQSPLNVHQQQQRARAFTCYTCKGEKHTQRQCNWVRGEPNPSTICQLCNQFGHDANGCRHLQGNGTTPMSSGRGRFGGHGRRAPEAGHR